jgi:hypothetical protein
MSTGKDAAIGLDCRQRLGEANLESGLAEEHQPAERQQKLKRYIGGTQSAPVRLALDD